MKEEKRASFIFQYFIWFDLPTLCMVTKPLPNHAWFHPFFFDIRKWTNKNGPSSLCKVEWASLSPPLDDTNDRNRHSFLYSYLLVSQAFLFRVWNWINFSSIIILIFQFRSTLNDRIKYLFKLPKSRRISRISKKILENLWKSQGKSWIPP